MTTWFQFPCYCVRQSHPQWNTIGLKSCIIKHWICSDWLVLCRIKLRFCIFTRNLLHRACLQYTDLRNIKKKVSHFLFVFKMFSYQRDLGNLTKRCFCSNAIEEPLLVRQRTFQRIVNSELYFQECRDFKIEVKEVIFHYWHLINVCPEKNTFRVSCGDWCALQHNTMVDLAVIQTDWAPGKVKPLL